MINYQHSIYYYGNDQQYRKVASIFINSVSNTLESIFSVMNGEPAASGVRVRYFFNPMTLRSMSVGDIIEVNGKAYRVAFEGYQLIEYQASHQYSYEREPEEYAPNGSNYHDHLCSCPGCNYDGDEEWDEYYGSHDDLGITDEDLAEFNARNIERGTAYGYWY